jgi:hypothetical protein
MGHSRQGPQSEKHGPVLLSGILASVSQQYFTESAWWGQSPRSSATRCCGLNSESMSEQHFRGQSKIKGCKVHIAECIDDGA